MSKSNPVIGSCPCPRTGCKHICSVKKFAHRATTDKGRRNAGKLYIDCPEDGRFGFDGKPGMQNWILEHATLDGQAPPSPTPERKPAAEAAPASAPGNGAAAPAASAAAAKKPAKSDAWTLLG